MLVINRQLRIPREEFEFSYARSGGPGGQNVNKTNTKVMLRWPVRSTASLPESVRERFLQRYARRITTGGDVIVSSQRFRDQARNLSDCLEKLRAMVLEVVEPPKRRRPTRSTRAARERRLQEKKRRSLSKRLRRPPGSDA